MEYREAEVHDKKEVWKKFGLLKLIEIVSVFGVIPTIVFVPYYFALFLNKQFDFHIGTSLFQIWASGLFVILVALVVILLSGFIIWAWLSLNWGWAKRWAETKEEKEKRYRKMYVHVKGDKVYIKNEPKVGPCTVQENYYFSAASTPDRRFRIKLDKGKDEYYYPDELMEKKPKPKARKKK